MHEQERVDRAHSLQKIARQARAAGDGEACIHALTEAQKVVDRRAEALLYARLSWRLAKASHDFGTPEQMLDAITPLIRRGDAFDHHTSARQAVQPISHRWWTDRGYGDERVHKLWQDWAASWRGEREPYMEAKGLTQGAWQLACAGQLDALMELVRRYLALTPKAFGTGDYRDPRADDCTASLPYVHMDLARTALRAATWMRDERTAWHMMDALEEAMEETGSDRSHDLWYLEPVLRGAAVFGWQEPRQWVGIYRGRLASATHERMAFHRALGRATLAQLQDGDPRPDLRAALAATKPDHGREWALLAQVELASTEAKHGDKSSAAAILTTAQTQVQRFHLHGFQPAIEAVTRAL